MLRSHKDSWERDRMLYGEGYNGACSHPLCSVWSMVIDPIEHRRSVRSMVIDPIERPLAVMYIYGLECPYGAFVLHSNSFLEYYSLFIDSCKVYSSDLYSTPIFLPEVPNQHNPLDTIPSYLTSDYLILFIRRSDCTLFQYIKYPLLQYNLSIKYPL